MNLLLLLVTALVVNSNDKNSRPCPSLWVETENHLQHPVDVSNVQTAFEENLKCPINHIIMVGLVIIVQSGQVYEGETLQQWIEMRKHSLAENESRFWYRTGVYQLSSFTKFG